MNIKQTLGHQDSNLPMKLQLCMCVYLPSSLTSLWCDCVSEWSGQCTSLLDTSIRKTYYDWLHHLLPAARWRTHWLRDGWSYCHYCHHHWTNDRGYLLHYHGGHLQYTTQYCDCCKDFHYRYDMVIVGGT